MAEIQLQLIHMADGRIAARRYYESIQNILSKGLTALKNASMSKNVDLELYRNVEAYILHFLETSHKVAFKNAWPVEGDLERSNAWTKPWHRQPKVQKAINTFGPDAFPSYRPPLPVVSARSSMMTNPNFSHPVTDLRHKNPWCAASQIGFSSGYKIDDAEDRCIHLHEKRAHRKPNHRGT